MTAFLKEVKELRSKGDDKDERLSRPEKLRIGKKSDSDTDTERIIDLSSQSGTDTS